MATVTGFTAARMLAIEGASVVDGDIVGGHLILTKHGIRSRVVSVEVRIYSSPSRTDSSL